MTQPRNESRSPDPRAVGKRWTGHLLASVLLAPLVGCSGSDDTPASSEASATMGIAGGTPDGPDGVQLIVPAGALTQDTTLRIARSGSGAPVVPDGASASTATYEFTPYGLEVRLPVTIRMPFSPSATAAAADIFEASPGEDWRAMQATLANGMAEFQRLSLSWCAGLLRGIPIGDTDPYVCVMCWDSNLYGQLGIGVTTLSEFPTSTVAGAVFWR